MAYIGQTAPITLASDATVTNLTVTGPLTVGGKFTASGETLLPAGTIAQRPASPAAGSVRFNTTVNAYEGYNGTGWVYLNEPAVSVEYLVIAGGGSGGANGGAGGGAGGYRSSVTGESSGGGASAESPLSIAFGTAYTVTVGAGGASVTGTTRGNFGADSVFASVTALGGGGGGGYNSAPLAGGGSGGGGGGSSAHPGAAGTAGQGYAGGAGAVSGAGGGGGGAGQTGFNGTDSGGDGGNGVQSSVTGSAVYRAGGGGGMDNTSPYNDGSGGLGGGGDGNQGGNAFSGTPNTGGGGGGTRAVFNSGSGGSGVIILKVPAGLSATFSAGVTQTSATVGSDTVYTITAAGASDTVTFA